MRRLGRLLIFLIVFAAIGAGITYVIAGRGAPPSLTVDKPDRLVGRTGELEVTAAAPGARFTALSITLEQEGRTTPLFSLDTPDSATVTQVDADRIRITRAI